MEERERELAKMGDVGEQKWMRERGWTRPFLCMIVEWHGTLLCSECDTLGQSSLLFVLEWKNDGAAKWHFFGDALKHSSPVLGSQSVIQIISSE